MGHDCGKLQTDEGHFGGHRMSLNLSLGMSLGFKQFNLAI